MLQSILRCYERFRLSTYRSMFGLLRERDGSLSATEAFSVDVIHLLQGPTIKEFADCLGISQPNATYRVNCLIRKGYVTRVPSDTDRREYHLELTEKFKGCGHAFEQSCRVLSKRIAMRMTREETEKLTATSDSW